MKKIFDFILFSSGKYILSGIFFYFVGIALNSIIIRELSGINPVEIPIWSSYGFLFALMAALAAIPTRWVFKVLKEQEIQDRKEGKQRTEDEIEE